MGSYQIKFCSTDNRRGQKQNGRGQKQKEYRNEGREEFPSEQVRGNQRQRAELNKHCILYFLLLYCLLFASFLKKTSHLDEMWLPQGGVEFLYDYLSSSFSDLSELLLLLLLLSRFSRVRLCATP